MPLLRIEHSVGAHRADFLVYVTAALALAGWLAVRAPVTSWLVLARLGGLLLSGLALWTLLEYALHRFVLHGLQPFSGWHARHHHRPMALIGTPTVVSAPLFALLVALPALVALGPWYGAAFTLGVLLGYLAYAFTHDALHQRTPVHAWWKERKFAHARHHHLLQPCCFGVTTSFWDRVFRTRGHAINSAGVHIPVVRRRG